jgi:hypothetical protein
MTSRITYLVRRGALGLAPSRPTLGLARVHRLHHVERVLDRGGLLLKREWARAGWRGRGHGAHGRTLGPKRVHGQRERLCSHEGSLLEVHEGLKSRGLRGPQGACVAAWLVCLAARDTLPGSRRDKAKNGW